LPELFYSLATLSHSNHTSGFQPIAYTTDIRLELNLFHSLAKSASFAVPPDQLGNFASQFRVFCAITVRIPQFVLKPYYCLSLLPFVRNPISFHFELSHIQAVENEVSVKLLCPDWQARV
jgi:hypothetical protein